MVVPVKPAMPRPGAMRHAAGNAALARLHVGGFTPPSPWIRRTVMAHADSFFEVVNRAGRLTQP